MNTIEIGKRMKDLRKLKGYTQQQLAEELDYSVPFISYLETGKATLTLPVALDFTTFFGVTMDYLLFGDTKRDEYTLKILSLLDHADAKEKKLILELLSVMLPILRNHL